ncbi:MAG: acyl CoA--acetate/3-ketoacid CoA transferase subunit beta [Deltaproteobacteria bacterium]|nr:acyl CoA--acetate/3-ketoacid CoA transferase subunit beta [Deltaproteobacteria bacterium]
MSSTSSRGYTDAEFMIAACARLMEDGKLVFVGYGMPQIAAILAQRLHAPNMVQVYEFGAVGARPVTPFVRYTMGGPSNCFRSIAWTNMNTIFAQASLGLVDLGVIGATQIDVYGNTNSTVVGGDYARPKRRFPGSGGANEVLSLCWRSIIVLMHEKRRFVEKVDFITSPGYLDGSPGAREREGLPRGTGPYRVVTSKALFGFDEATHRMTLLGVLQGLPVAEVVAEMEFQPLIADRVKELTPPTPGELRILREEIDPSRAIIGRTGS